MNTYFLLFFFDSFRYFLQIIFRAFSRLKKKKIHTFVSVCVNIDWILIDRVDIINTKFVCVEVDVVPSPDVYRYFLAKFPETLGTREYIAIWRAWL